MTTRRARLVLLSTGGTIASRAQAADRLVHYKLDQAGPPLDPDLLGLVEGFADIRHEEVVRMPSSDLGQAQLLELARRVHAHLASPDVDGIVITHGTDTLEETALFLALTTPPGKPVVMTAAMRPGGALGSDGPRNFLGAVRVAADQGARGRGVLVVMDDEIIAAPCARKRHANAVAAFRPEAGGLIGEVLPDRIVLAGGAPDGLPGFDVTGCAALPRVEILYAYQDAPAFLFDAVVASGAAGIVLACTGNGTLSTMAKAAVADAIGKGLVVVRSSRTGAGRVTWAESAGIPSGPLNPQQARILLSLALSRTKDADQIANWFAAF